MWNVLLFQVRDWLLFLLHFEHLLFSEEVGMYCTCNTLYDIDIVDKVDNVNRLSGVTDGHLYSEEMIIL